MAYVRIDTYTRELTLDGESRMNIRATAVGYSGDASRIVFRATLRIGSAVFRFSASAGQQSFFFAPNPSLLGGMPNDKVKAGTLQVDMLDTGGNTLGSPAQAEVMFAAGENLCRPVLMEGWAAVSPNNDGTQFPADVYVKGSRARVVFTQSKVQFMYGATAAEYANARWKVICGGNSAETDGIINRGDALSVTLPASGSVTVICRVNDSRGFSAEQAFTIEVRSNEPRAQILSVTSQITLDGQNAVTVKAGISDYIVAPPVVYYRAAVRVGGASWTSPGRSADGTLVFVPDVSLLTGMPDSKTGTAIITVTIEDESGASLGPYAEKSIAVTAAEGICRPALLEGWATFSADNAGTGYPEGVYVKGARVRAAFDLSKVQFKYGASAAAYESGRWKASISGAVVQTGANNQTDTLVLTLTNAGSITIICTVRDSRGFETSQNYTITAYEYTAPTMTAVEAYRSDSTGAADDMGAYIRVKARVNYASLGGANGITTFFCEYAPTGGGDAVRTGLENDVPRLIGAGSLSSTRSYRVRIYAEDRCAGRTEFSTIISTSDISLHILPGGRGAAFGKYSERENVLDIGGWDMQTAGLMLGDSLYIGGEDPSVRFGGTWNRTAEDLPFSVWQRTS